MKTTRPIFNFEAVSMIKEVETDLIIDEMERIIKKHARSLARQIMEKRKLVISFDNLTKEYKSELK